MGGISGPCGIPPIASRRLRLDQAYSDYVNTIAQHSVTPRLFIKLAISMVEVQNKVS